MPSTAAIARSTACRSAGVALSSGSGPARNISKLTTPSAFRVGMASRLRGTASPWRAKSTIDRAAASTVAWNASAESSSGSVLGMHMIVVTPPVAAAAEHDAKSSLWV